MTRLPVFAGGYMRSLGVLNRNPRLEPKEAFDKASDKLDFHAGLAFSYGSRIPYPTTPGERDETKEALSITQGQLEAALEAVKIMKRNL